MLDRASVSEDDLRVLLRDRAGEPDHRSGRLVEVQQRVGRLRRRRMAATGAVAVAAVVAGIIGVAPSGDGGRTGQPIASGPPPATPSSTPSASPRPSGTLPEYLRGGRLAASVERSDPTGVSLTFTPSTLAFGIVAACTTPGADVGNAANPSSQVTIDGKSYIGFSCSPSGPMGTDGGSDMSRPSQDFAQAYGLHVGKPVHVSLSWGDGVSRIGTAWRLAVYEAVPLAQYPFPARPATLLTPELGFSPLYPQDVSLFTAAATATHPNTTVTNADVTLRHGLTISGVAVEPGQIEVLVNGHVVSLSRSWDYTEQSFSAGADLASMGLKAGAHVAITIRTERFTAASWQVVIFDSTS